MPHLSPEQPLPDDVLIALRAHALPEDEVGLRVALDAYALGWELFRLTPAAAKRWKCRYRILMDAGYYDGQSAAEAYARALLATQGQPFAEEKKMGEHR